MECVLLMGLQASGKSTFCAQHLFDSHIRVNLDMLRTRHREKCLVRTCIEAGISFVVDNTNPTRADRQRYIEPARTAGCRVIGYYFQSGIENCKQRNASRDEQRRIPLAGLLATYGRLELPSYEEGFDSLYYVRIAEDSAFAIEEWTDEI